MNKSNFVFVLLTVQFFYTTNYIYYIYFFNYKCVLCVFNDLLHFLLICIFWLLCTATWNVLQKCLKVWRTSCTESILCHLHGWNIYTILLTYNVSGPKTEPCGTPFVSSSQFNPLFLLQMDQIQFYIVKSVFLYWFVWFSVTFWVEMKIKKITELLLSGWVGQLVYLINKNNSPVFLWWYQHTQRWPPNQTPHRLTGEWQRGRSGGKDLPPTSHW